MGIRIQQHIICLQLLTIPRLTISSPVLLLSRISYCLPRNLLQNHKGVNRKTLDSLYIVLMAGNNYFLYPPRIF